jgi:hypothetical protein
MDSTGKESVAVADGWTVSLVAVSARSTPTQDALSKRRRPRHSSAGAQPLRSVEDLLIDELLDEEAEAFYAALNV